MQSLLRIKVPARPLVSCVLVLAACASTSAWAQKSSLEVPTNVTMINGAVPPGKASVTLSSKNVLNVSSPAGKKTIAFQSVRAPGTRSPFHQHAYGGLTCVAEGQMTLYAEGAKPQVANARECYWMPPGTTVSGVNSGTQNAVIFDSFTSPMDVTSVWTVVEKGAESMQGELTIMNAH